MLLRLDRIITNGGTQPRAAMHEETIAEYAEAMEGGAKFPLVTVFHDGERYWLADGFHRVAASKRAGFLDIEVEVKQGSRRDAILFSLGANATHGLRRTNEDKRRAVKFMLDDPDWCGWSSRDIAKACGVGHALVARMKQAAGLSDGASVSERQIADPRGVPDAQVEPPPAVVKVQRGDTVYEMDVSAIGRSRPAKPAADPEIELAGEIAQAEAEIGVALTEVEQLKKELAEARETIAVLTEQVEWLTRAADGNAADELKKLAVQLRTVERVRDDYMQQNSQLKSEFKRLERRLAAQTGGVRAYA